MPVDPSPGAPSLVLVPTAFERDALLPHLAPGLGLVELCGFGPLAAAARTAELLARLGPRRVTLVGIGGSYDLETHPVGSAARFGEVVLDGVGAGQGPDRLGPAEMGLAQWEDVLDHLPLASDGPRLVTVTAASGDLAQAEERRERFGGAAEDMEAFAVALACRRTGTPLDVVRGISNLAGDRERAGWDVQGALAAAAELLP